MIDSVIMLVIKFYCRFLVFGLDGGGVVVKIDIIIGGKKMSGVGFGIVGGKSEGVESSS